MATVRFTQNLQRHVPLPTTDQPGESVAEVLKAVFDQTPAARSYILDDQGGLRAHVVVFVDGELVRDRRRLCDPVAPNSTLDVMQALSGG